MTDSKDSITAVAERLREEKRARARAILVQLAFFVLLPTLVAAGYFALFASPQFDSTMILAVRSGVDIQSDARGSKDVSKDAAELSDYVESHEMLAALDEAGRFTEHFTAAEIDRLSRLGRDAGSETRHRYYRRHVDVRVDDRSDHLRVTVTAYDADVAHELASQLLAELEARVEQLYEASRRDAMDSAKESVEKAREALVSARLAFAKQQAAASSQPTGVLGPGDVAPSKEYAETELQLSLANTEYESAVQELSETRRANAALRRYLEVVAAPSRPTQPTGPLRLRTILTAFLVSLAVYAIGSLLVASIREHARL